LGLATSYSYNANNTVTTVTKPSGLQIQNSYDQTLRLIPESDPYATSGFAYDKNGQLTQPPKTPMVRPGKSTKRMTPGKIDFLRRRGRQHHWLCVRYLPV